MRGEMEAVGAVIRRCLEATEHGKYYRPRRPFKHRKTPVVIRDVQQLAFKFDNPIRDLAEAVSISEPRTINSSAITPDNPITDDDVPF